MKKIIIILCMLFAVNSVIVGNTFAANGWYGPMKVTSVIIHGIAYLIETNYALNDCGGQGRFSVLKETSMAQDIYKTATLALLTSRNVYIYVDGAQGCSVGGMVSTFMILQ